MILSLMRIAQILIGPHQEGQGTEVYPFRAGSKKDNLFDPDGHLPPARYPVGAFFYQN